MRGVLLAAALVAAASSSRAQSPAQDAAQACVGGAPPAGASAGLPAFERTDVKALGDILTCYCGCPHLQVSKCFCGTADAIRQDLALRLDRGETPDQIVAAYVLEHGEGVLGVPPRKGFNWLIWVLPPVVVIAGALGVVLMGRRWRAPPPGPTPTQPLVDDQLREELRRAVEGEA